MTRDALDELIVSEPSDPVKIVADLIKDYVKLVKDGNLQFEPNFYEQQEWKRVLIVLIGRKALAIKKLIKNEEISRKEVSTLATLPATSVTRALSRELKGIVKRGSKEGVYFVPNYNLLRCKKLIEKKYSKEK